MGLPRISGTVACSVRDIIRERLGAARYAEFAELLPGGGAKQAILYATTLDWLPVEDFNASYLAMSRIVGGTPARIAAELAEASVARTLSTVWRALLHFTTDQALVKRAPLLYEKTFDTGRAVTTFEGDRRVRVRVTGWAAIPELSVVSLGVGIENVLRFAGRSVARIQPRRTADGVEFLGQW